ncbi:type IV toxin-antitoxin system AbiEi family antitoxin [Pseudonocardia sp. N23]|uniref:type IV toxin-antitoxin system AbiEi family antitoxin n=1 Tax=Pseudonocardia sp. N23 TaxID=1987376 RepID=UPI000BFE60A0|nr:hypothetical protein [Pseudonocardia sp. N23]GAY13190.1 hypothetical protein TOK_2109 [Pseudonocardia sp. N23]
MCLEELVARQAGVVTRAQALAAGLSIGDVDRRVARRRWRPLHPRVYLAGDAPHTDEVRVRAAVLWAGEGAVLAGTAAAWWSGFPVRAPSTIAVTVPRRRAPGSRPGVVVRRRTLPVPDLAEHRGLPVTAPPLTIVEAALELGAAGAAFLDAVLWRDDAVRWREVAMLRREVVFEEVVAASRRADGTGERVLAEAWARATARLRLAGMLRRAGVAAHVAGTAVVCPVARVLVTDDPDHREPAGWSVLAVSGRERPEDIVATVRGVRITA